jgi:holo-[acyl-carrier protein] synthase
MKNGVNIGCDIVSVSRIEKMMSSPTALKRVFHPSELTRFDAEHLAGIFAVKEAAFKALGIDSNSWHLIEVTYHSSGKPELILAEQIKDSTIHSIDCSISHDAGLAFAVVCVLKK